MKKDGKRARNGKMNRRTAARIERLETE